MPGLWSRFMLIFRSKASKALDRAENPNETLDYSYERQLEQLQNVKRGIADVTTAKKRLELQYTSMQQQVDKLDGQARDALTANREDLAREALTRKAAVQGQLQGIMAQGQQLEAQQQKLIEGERTLQAKVESFRTQKEVIKAQYSAAEAQVRISEAATGLGDDMADVGRAIERAKDKTAADAGAGERSRRADDGGCARRSHRHRRRHRSAAAQISQSGQVDDELAKMKAELGSGAAPAKQLEGESAPAVMTREVVLAARPQGAPQEADFALREVDEREPGEGEVLVRNVFVSVDPYMRSRMSGIRTYVGAFEVGGSIDGAAVGRVVASNDPGCRRRRLGALAARLVRARSRQRFASAQARSRALPRPRWRSARSA